MTALTFDEIRAYCEPLAVGVEAGRVRRMRFLRTPECRVHVGRFAAAADAAFDTAAALLEPEAADFRGALLWVSGYYASFKNWESAFRRIRLGWGVTSPVDDTPGHRFGPEEFADAVTLMGFLMTFGWDVTWLPAHGDYLMAANEDQFIDFAVRGGGGRWDTDRRELFENLGFEHRPHMTGWYCEA
jgi:hypothetical protein